MPGWNPATKQQDIADAKKLMEAAGFADGKLSFSIMPSGPTGQYYDHSVRMQDQLKKVWPAMSPTIAVPADGATWARNLGTGMFDALPFADTPAPSALLLVASYFRSGGGQNYTKASEPALDSLIDAAFTEFDTNARYKLFDQLQQMLVDLMLLIPLGKWALVEGVHPRMHGFKEYTGLGGWNSYDTVYGIDSFWIA